jgi:hypothetical protein
MALPARIISCSTEFFVILVMPDIAKLQRVSGYARDKYSWRLWCRNTTSKSG